MIIAMPVGVRTGIALTATGRASTTTKVSKPRRTGNSEGALRRVTVSVTSITRPENSLAKGLIGRNRDELPRAEGRREIRCLNTSSPVYTVRVS